MTERTAKPGLGAPLLAEGRDLRADASREFALDRTYYGVTAIARFEGRRVVIGFEDPLASETTSFGGRRYPLAADFTVPVAVMLARENPKKMEIARVLSPEKYAKTAHIVRLQPYDPNKTVVLVVHGLMDSAATWTPLLIKLRSYADIRQNYQFWFYSYPSGYPYPYSAAIMREQLDAIPNSVDTLSPNNQFVKIVNTIPLTPGIPFHSIMGDRGRGDTPNSSDGVVPYWISHLDGAQSEMIVPSGHSAHQNPKAIAEVRRILLLNAGITSHE